MPAPPIVIDGQLIMGLASGEVDVFIPMSET
jgi:hypothetical protein